MVEEAAAAALASLAAASPANEAALASALTSLAAVAPANEAALASAAEAAALLAWEVCKIKVEEDDGGEEAAGTDLLDADYGR
jgi:hypothetical protein